MKMIECVGGGKRGERNHMRGIGTMNALRETRGGHVIETRGGGMRVMTGGTMNALRETRGGLRDTKTTECIGGGERGERGGMMRTICVIESIGRCVIKRKRV